MVLGAAESRMNQSNMSLSSVATSQQNRSMFLSPTSIGSLGSPSAGTTGMAPELELHWDPETIRTELHTASIVLSQRCLKLAAKWASEQLIGLPTIHNNKGQQKTGSDDTAPSMTVSNSIMENPQILAVLQETNPSVLYAKSLMELGEYMHAAAVLSVPNTIVTTMSPPLPDLSSYGIYLRAYALFMAGERRKEEDYIEIQRCVFSSFFLCCRCLLLLFFSFSLLCSHFFVHF